jgi:hypothetical protein
MTALFAYSIYVAMLVAFFGWTYGCPRHWIFRSCQPWWLQSLRAELAPFAAPMVVVKYFSYIAYLHLGEGRTGIQVVPAFILAIELSIWLICRKHTDDDRWRRRRRKAADRIRAVAGRLAVVPGGVS